MTLLRALADDLPLQARPVESGDGDFLHALYASVREQELAAAGWSPAEGRTFLAQQFECQHRYYSQHFADAEFLLLLHSHGRIGRLYWHAAAASATLMDISLVPEWRGRGRGLGTALMRRVTEHADACGRSIGLHVEPANPARRLYERFAFEAMAENGVYVKMRRAATQVTATVAQEVPA
jgi:ribosomal protein S18 acetylase RimI-like enzyme